MSEQTDGEPVLSDATFLHILSANHPKPRVRRIRKVDIYLRGFLKLLEQLAPVHLTVDQAVTIYWTRGARGAPTLVVVRGDRVVGTASYFVEQKYIHGGGKVGYVEEVVVDRKERGKGVGRALVAECVAQLRKRGCYKVILSCSDDNVGFYERLGFHRAANTMRMDLTDGS